jgi:hypothetical protein
MPALAPDRPPRLPIRPSRSAPVYFLLRPQLLTQPFAFLSDRTRSNCFLSIPRLSGSELDAELDALRDQLSGRATEHILWALQGLTSPRPTLSKRRRIVGSWGD